MAKLSTIIIERDDLADVDPITLQAEGVQIGRLPSCEIVLNHPSVSRLHAGIKEERGRFYLFNFSHSSGTIINGRVIPIDEYEVIADGDVVQVGPFFLYFQREREGLRVRVSLEFALRIGETQGRGEGAQAPDLTQSQAIAPTFVAGAKPKEEEKSDEISQAMGVYWKARRREQGKMQRLSPLRPRTPARVVGKARWNWTPTRDLVRPWPFAVFVWGGIIVALLSGVAAFAYTNAYSPAPISDPHQRASLTPQAGVAREPNANSCTSCHTIKTGMDENCASCHTTAQHSFAATKEHQEAGIGCTDCHNEHQGTDFRPALAALSNCATCHNDANKATYNGRRVSTPHGGTFGYPVVNGRWQWEGLGQEEWELKPAQVRDVLRETERMLMRSHPGDPAGARRSAEFHVLHLYRVKAVGGLPANTSGEMSCSSCHRSFGQNIDRQTPRTTCDKCHNGDVDGRNAQIFTASGGQKLPHCTSCHVQHVKGRRNWGSSLLAEAGARDAAASPDRAGAGAQAR